MSAAVVAVAAAGAYIVLAARVRWYTLRTIAYVAGVGVAAAAVALDFEAVWAHMLEHSLLAVVAAPLLVAGSPLALLLRALPAHRRPPLLAVVRSRAVRALTSPAVAWALFVATQWALHVPPLFPRLLEDRGLDLLEHAVILLTGVLFWLPVLGRNPVGAPLRDSGRVVYLFLALPAVDLIALRFLAAGEQKPAVAMMAGMLPLGAAAVAVTVGWVVREERRALRWEAYTDARA